MDPYSQLLGATDSMQLEFAQLNRVEQETFCLYKANSPFAGQMCFADYVNQVLRDELNIPQVWQKKIDTLDTLIERAALDEDSILFRATIDCFVAPYISGNELVYPAYMSTATDKIGLERHFSGCIHDIPAALLHIACPKDAVALNMEMNSAFGGHEREYLLPRNSKFVVAEVQYVTNREIMNKQMSEFYAKNYSALNIYELQYVGCD